MTDTDITTQQLTRFIAEWMTRDHYANIQGEPEACFGRMHEAVTAAFPKASRAEVEAAVGVTIDRIDRLPRDVPPAGWHVLDVAKADGSGRRWDWVALMVDVHPDELKHCHCRTAFLYVHPDDYKPDGTRVAKEAWVRVPGKHRSRDDAWDAFEDLLATRH